MPYQNPSNTQTTRPKNSPSPALAQLIAEDISLRDLIDSAFNGLTSLQEEIREAGTARTRLHALISQCNEDSDPSVKTVQEIGYYNTELREWTARLGALEAELETLRDDVRFLAAPSANALLCAHSKEIEQMENLTSHRSTTFRIASLPWETHITHLLR